MLADSRSLHAELEILLISASCLRLLLQLDLLREMLLQLTNEVTLLSAALALLAPERKGGTREEQRDE